MLFISGSNNGNNIGVYKFVKNTTKMPSQYGTDYYAIDSNYDNMLFKGRKPFHYIFWRRKLKKLTENGMLLDIGCGKGFFLEYMAKFYSTMGIDVSKYAVLESKKILRRVPLCVADATNLCFKNETFDIVTAFDIIEHVNNPKQMFDECHSLLRSKGLLVLTTPNTNSIGRKLKQNEWFGYRDSTHVSLLSPSEWTVLLEESGFKVVSTYYDGMWDSPYFTKVPKLLQHLVFKFLSTILLYFGITFPQKYGEDLYLIARKV